MVRCCQVAFGCREPRFSYLSRGSGFESGLERWIENTAPHRMHPQLTVQSQTADEPWPISVFESR